MKLSLSSQARVLEAVRDAGIGRGEVAVVDVRHDPWCALVTIGTCARCNCSPDVSLRSTSRTLH